MGLDKIEVEKHLIEHEIIHNDSRLLIRGIRKNNVDVHNGIIREFFNALVTSNGSTVTLTLTNAGGGDLTLKFSDGEHIFSTSSGNTIALTAGSDISPTENFIYILKSDRILTKSISDWPTVEHTKIGYYLVPSAGFVQTNGTYINQNWNDDISGTDGMGDLAHIGEKLRRLTASYFSGVDGNGTQGYLTPAAGNTELKSTAGIIYQKHKHTFSAFDTSAGDMVLVKNWVGDAFHDITNLYDITADSTGTTIGNNKFFNLVIWGAVNKTGEYSPLLINLPGGFYNTQSAAEEDVSGHDDFSMPKEFNRESSTGFLIARITIQMKTGGGTWIVSSTTDLRGQTPNTASGGVGSIVQEFADNAFKIFDETDITKEGAFDVGTNVATGTTRTLQIPNANGIIALTAQTDGTIDVSDITDIATTYLQIGGANANTTIDIGAEDFTTTGIGTLGTLVVDTNTLVVNPAGATDKVGIGVAIPLQLLHLEAPATTVMLIRSLGNQSTGRALFQMARFNADALPFGLGWDFGVNLGLSNDDFTIRELNAGGSFSYRMTIIKGTGHIGFSPLTTADARVEIETTTTEGAQALTIDQNDVDKAFIDFQGLSTAGVTTNISSCKGGGTIDGPKLASGAGQSGWNFCTSGRMVLMEVNGCPMWIPAYVLVTNP